MTKQPEIPAGYKWANCDGLYVPLPDGWNLWREGSEGWASAHHITPTLPSAEQFQRTPSPFNEPGFTSVCMRGVYYVLSESARTVAGLQAASHWEGQGYEPVGGEFDAIEDDGEDTITYREMLTHSGNPARTGLWTGPLYAYAAIVGSNRRDIVYRTIFKAGPKDWARLEHIARIMIEGIRLGEDEGEPPTLPR